MGESDSWRELRNGQSTAKGARAASERVGGRESEKKRNSLQTTLTPDPEKLYK